MGRAKFTVTPDLDKIVAAMIRPEVGRIANEAGRVAKRLAPPTKTWVSMLDARVRQPHAHAHGDEVPDNLRFKLTAFAYDLEHPGHLPFGEGGPGEPGSGWSGTAKTVAGSYSYLLYPRDRSQGHYVQIVNCRCVLSLDPQGVAKMIRVTEPTVVGTKVSATVIAEGAYVVEAERGEVYPGGLVSEGTWFMQRMVGQMGAAAQ